MPGIMQGKRDVPRLWGSIALCYLRAVVNIRLRFSIVLHTPPCNGVTQLHNGVGLLKRDCSGIKEH